MKLEIRKSNKAEKAAYVEQAIQAARIGLPQHEGSRQPTGRTIYYVQTTHEALERFAQLKAEGWELCNSSTALVVAPQVPLSFVAIAPDHVFETYIPLITASAEAAYEKEIIQHNELFKKQEQRAKEVLEEFERRESERKAALMAEIELEVEARHNPRFERADRTKLHA
ncbi:hypothetical protein [Pseudomonas sp. FW305-70]|uniref:hypothetical protein n=1 Tax=Pseudomonas sp. FW305-70 TaxID=2751342 RepID=UPI0011AFBC05|nr:hypothetical protein [Pseudomonas sp. FW305-70]